MIVIELNTTGDVLEAINRASAVLEPARLQEIIGIAGVEVTQRHLATLGASYRNKLGAPSTGFYMAASQSVNWRAQGDGVAISIPHQGMAQRYYGGTITAKTAKYLTIPAIAEAHGKRASQIPNLEFAIIGGKAALIRRAQTSLGFRKDRRKGRAGLKRAYAVAELPEQVVFWLKKSVTQQADPSVLPTEKQLLDTITARIESNIRSATP